MSLQKKLAHHLLKKEYRFPTADEIVKITDDGQDIILGERMIDRGDVHYFGKSLSRLVDNEVLTHVINAVLFKWQSNIINSGSDKNLQQIRDVAELYSDTEVIIQKINEVYQKQLSLIDKN